MAGGVSRWGTALLHNSLIKELAWHTKHKSYHSILPSIHKTIMIWRHCNSWFDQAGLSPVIQNDFTHYTAGKLTVLNTTNTWFSFYFNYTGTSHWIFYLFDINDLKKHFLLCSQKAFHSLKTMTEIASRPWNVLLELIWNAKHNACHSIQCQLHSTPFTHRRPEHIATVDSDK